MANFHFPEVRSVYRLLAGLVVHRILDEEWADCQVNSHESHIAQRPQ
jgi:hypothetical protein